MGSRGHTETPARSSWGELFPEWTLGVFKPQENLCAPVAVKEGNLGAAGPPCHWLRILSCPLVPSQPSSLVVVARYITLPRKLVDLFRMLEPHFLPLLPPSGNPVLPFQLSRRPFWPHPPSCSPGSILLRCPCSSLRQAGLPCPQDTALLQGPQDTPLELERSVSHLPPRLYLRSFPHSCSPPQCQVPPHWGPLDPPHSSRGRL